MTVQDSPTERRVTVRGAVDLESSPQLGAKLRSALQGTPALAVSLTEVSYMDSSGLATLIQALKLANRTAVKFRLLAPSDQVQSVLELAQLHQLFTIDADPA